MFLVVQLRELLKRYKASAGVNRAVTYTACVVLPLVSVVLVTALVLTSGGRRLAGSDEPPLALADLVEAPADGELDQDVRLSQSPLLAVLDVSQYLRLGRSPGDPVPHWLQYTVIEVRAPFLYDVCKGRLLDKNGALGTDRLPVKYYVPIDPAPWGAEEAYQSAYEDSGPMDDYLLCYPDRIVAFDPDWEPTQGQMALVGEKLGRGPL